MILTAGCSPLPISGTHAVAMQVDALRITFDDRDVSTNGLAITRQEILARICNAGLCLSWFTFDIVQTILD